jgi:hypothetical protein
MAESHRPPDRRANLKTTRRSPTAFTIIFLVFVAALIAIFVSRDALFPSQAEGDINADKVEGGGPLKPKLP